MYQAAESPAGPDPITATLLPEGGSRFTLIFPKSPAYLLSRHTDTAWSMGFLRHAPSHGAGQILPRMEGNAISLFTTSRAASKFPEASSRFIRGIFICAGQEIWQGASQSPTWSDNRSSRAVFLASRTSVSLVMISMPSSGRTEQLGKSFPVFRFLTTHSMQVANGSRESR